MSVRRRLERLEGMSRPGPEDEAERRKRLKMVREAAEQENERFYRYLAIERRGAFLEDAGFGGHAAEDLRDENFLYPDDRPPFDIAEDGAVFSSRDGKPITHYPQTLAEVWYWKEADTGELHLVHDEGAEAFYTRSEELAISRDCVDLRHVFKEIEELERRIRDQDAQKERLEGEG